MPSLVVIVCGQAQAAIKCVARDPNPQAIAVHGDIGFFLVSRLPGEANSVSPGQNGRNEAADDSERDTAQRHWQYAHSFGSHPLAPMGLVLCLGPLLRRVGFQHAVDVGFPGEGFVLLGVEGRKLGLRLV